MPHVDVARPANDLMTLPETAASLRTPVATLRNWRHLGVGPAGFRLGRRVIRRTTWPAKPLPGNVRSTLKVDRL